MASLTPRCVTVPDGNGAWVEGGRIGGWVARGAGSKREGVGRREGGRAWEGNRQARQNIHHRKGKMNSTAQVRMGHCSSHTALCLPSLAALPARASHCIPPSPFPSSKALLISLINLTVQQRQLHHQSEILHEDRRRTHSLSLPL